MATYINGGNTSVITATPIKLAVRAASQGNLAGTRVGDVITANASVALTKALIDAGWSTGPALAPGNRILLVHQTDPSDNGVYVITSLGPPWTLTRSSDANSIVNVVPQMLVPVSEGTEINTSYQLTVAAPITVNVTGLIFTIFGGTPSGSAGGDLLGSNYPNPIIKNGAVDLSKLSAGVSALIPTADQKSALTGTDGTPSATNKYVTCSDPRVVNALNLTTHADINNLVHNLSQTSYTEVTRVSGQVTNVTVWQTSGKVLKVRETVITRAAGAVSVVVEMQYTAGGVLSQTLTQSFTRTSGQVTSINTVET